MLSFLFDDLGVPQDYRHVEGFGVNTYTLIKKAGKAHYVKYSSFTGNPPCIIEKENNLKQPGERYRSLAPDRQERFIRRWADPSLGQKIASDLNLRPSI
ncbi:unnamed protein product [Lupinus luteus]|uniref:catalase n=1 Tax=Lupinus luteus TaxID=3873 RepID=A0AAV1Y4B4_LUPLU